jgi:hypothetical protein
MKNSCSGCMPSMAEGLGRVLAVRDTLDLILWGKADPDQGLERAITALGHARRCFQAATDGKR